MLTLAPSYADLRDDRSTTLLGLAAWHGRSKIAAWLLQRQAEIDPDDKLERRVFRVNLNARDQKGWTPCAIAAFHGSKDILAMLISHGADCTAPNAFKLTPLELASSDEIRELLESARGVTGAHGARQYCDEPLDEGDGARSLSVGPGVRAEVAPSKREVMVADRQKSVRGRGKRGRGKKLAGRRKVR